MTYLFGEKKEYQVTITIGWKGEGKQAKTIVKVWLN